MYTNRLLINIKTIAEKQIELPVRTALQKKSIALMVSDKAQDKPSNRILQFF